MKKPETLATLPNIGAFCVTFEAGNFTRAAELLGQTPQAVSRAVARLEANIGATLFRRTTRTLQATDQGRAYYEACKQALSTLSNAEQQLQNRQSSPAGKVRISAPTTYGHHKLLPRLGVFRQKFPQVEVEVNVSNRNIDFVKEGYDLSIRMGQIKEQGMIAKKLGEFSLGLFASPSYLKLHPKLTSIEQLSSHQCIIFLLPSTGRALAWELARAPHQYVPRASYEVSEDPLAMITMARAGVGVIQTYHFLVERELREKTLVEVLPLYGGVTRRFSLLYPGSVTQTRAVKALADFIVAG